MQSCLRRNSLLQQIFARKRKLVGFERPVAPAIVGSNSDEPNFQGRPTHQPHRQPQGKLENFDSTMWFRVEEVLGCCWLEFVSRRSEEGDGWHDPILDVTATRSLRFIFQLQPSKVCDQSSDA